MFRAWPVAGAGEAPDISECDDVEEMGSLCESGKENRRSENFDTPKDNPPISENESPASDPEAAQRSAFIRVLENEAEAGRVGGELDLDCDDNSENKILMQAVNKAQTQLFSANRELHGLRMCKKKDGEVIERLCDTLEARIAREASLQATIEDLESEADLLTGKLHKAEGARKLLEDQCHETSAINQHHNQVCKNALDRLNKRDRERATVRDRITYLEGKLRVLEIEKCQVEKENDALRTRLMDIKEGLVGDEKSAFEAKIVRLERLANDFKRELCEAKQELVNKNALCVHLETSVREEKEKVEMLKGSWVKTRQLKERSDKELVTLRNTLATTVENYEDRIRQDKLKVECRVEEATRACTVQQTKAREKVEGARSYAEAAVRRAQDLERVLEVCENKAKWQSQELKNLGNECGLKEDIITRMELELESAKMDCDDWKMKYMELEKQGLLQDIEVQRLNDALDAETEKRIDLENTVSKWKQGRRALIKKLSMDPTKDDNDDDVHNDDDNDNYDIDIDENDTNEGDDDHCLEGLVEEVEKFMLAHKERESALQSDIEERKNQLLSVKLSSYRELNASRNKNESDRMRLMLEYETQIVTLKQRLHQANELKNDALRKLAQAEALVKTQTAKLKALDRLKDLEASRRKLSEKEEECSALKGEVDCLQRELDMADSMGKSKSKPKPPQKPVLTLPNVGRGGQLLLE